MIRGLAHVYNKNSILKILSRLRSALSQKTLVVLDNVYDYKAMPMKLLKKAPSSKA